MTNMQFVAVSQPVEIKVDDRGLSVKCHLHDGCSAENVTEFLVMPKFFFFRKYESKRAMIHLVGVAKLGDSEYLVDEGVLIKDVMAVTTSGGLAMSTSIVQLDKEIAALATARREAIDKLTLPLDIINVIKAYESKVTE